MLPCFLSKVLMLYTVTLTQGKSSTTYNVSLSWNMEGDILSLKCLIKNMGLGAYFYGPRGDQKGHCNSPLLGNNINEVGTCDSGMIQTILSDNNVLNEIKIKLYECENGVWKCTHGVNRNEEDTQDVTMRINVSCPGIPSSTFERCLCVISLIICCYLLGYFTAKQIKHLRKYMRGDLLYTAMWGKRKCWQYALRKSLAVVMSIIVPFFVFKGVLGQGATTLTLLIALWSFVIGCLETLFADKILSKIDCICKSQQGTGTGANQPLQNNDVEAQDTCPENL